jgi:hypothetical protein
MTEETQVPEGQEPQERTYSEIELKAIDQGWIPKEEFDGDESEFIDAPEFVRRGELFKRIESQSKELKQVRQALDAFRVHHSKVKEAEYNRALKDLQAARKEATVNGDHEQAFALEEKIDEIKAEKQAIVEEAQKPTPEPETYTPEFQHWVENNPWYESNRVMHAAADQLGLQLHRQGYSPSEILKMVEKEIRQEFKHKFERPISNRDSAVEAPTRRGASKSDEVAMSAEEIEIMRKIVAVTPGYTEADYKKELKRIKGL